MEDICIYRPTRSSASTSTSPYHTMSPTTSLLNNLLTQLSKHSSPGEEESQSQPQPQPSNTQSLSLSLSQLHNQNPVSSNPLDRFPPEKASKIKPLLLTLHCLFPNELLLALDVLDRGLVRRISTITSTTTSISSMEMERGKGDIQDTDEPDNNAKGDKNKDGDIFFVTSSSTSASTHTEKNNPKTYEVRLHAWNCTCPTFSLMMFRGSDHHEGEDEMSDVEAKDLPEYSFGGTLTRRGSGVGVCKHLLACILGMRCPGLFEGGIYKGDCTRGELGGLCAGWGG